MNCATVLYVDYSGASKRGGSSIDWMHLIKQVKILHQNALLLHKIFKKIFGEGAVPLQCSICPKNSGGVAGWERRGARVEAP